MPPERERRDSLQQRGTEEPDCPERLTQSQGISSSTQKLHFCPFQEKPARGSGDLS